MNVSDYTKHIHYIIVEIEGNYRRRNICSAPVEARLPPNGLVAAAVEGPQNDSLHERAPGPIGERHMDMYIRVPYRS